MNALRQAWQEHLSKHPKARTIHVAEALGVTEAELLHARVGEDATLLRPDWKALLEGLPKLGEVMCLTRNAHVVHETTGPFEQVKYTPHMAGVYGEHIDQRLIVGRWAVAIAAPVETRRGSLDSIQIFDGAGAAVLKIYSRDKTDTAAWAELVQSLADAAGELPELAPRERADDAPDDAIDVEALREGWAAMTDTHDAFGLLRRLGVGRQQALRLVGATWAEPVSTDALAALLTGCAADGEPLMVFVGNTGSIQIYSGLVHRIAPMHGWLNVLDPRFNLHVRLEGLRSAWVVRKPTDRGAVLSLEVFDEHGDMAVQLFGKRTEDQSQRPSWHARIEALRTTHPAS